MDPLRAAPFLLTQARGFGCAIAMSLALAIGFSVPALAQASPPGMGARRAAAIDHREAERRLHKARAVRERGRAPRRDEVVADRGYLWTNGAYAQRQAQLDRSIAAAERRLQETSAGLHAARSGEREPSSSGRHFAQADSPGLVHDELGVDENR